MATIGDPGIPTRPKPSATLNPGEAYKMSILKPIPWYHSGTHLLAALFWLSYVTTVFLIVLRIVPADAISAGAAALFFALGAMVSFSASGRGK